MLPTCMALSPVACDRARHAYSALFVAESSSPTWWPGHFCWEGPYSMLLMRCSCAAHASLMLLYRLVLPDSCHINGAR